MRPGAAGWGLVLPDELDGIASAGALGGVGYGNYSEAGCVPLMP